MGAITGIQWCHHTFNAWWGCEKISPACKYCYAEKGSQRFGSFWGANALRRFFGDAHWSEPESWNRRAALAGERRRVFAGSYMDVWEARDDLEPHRWRLLRTVEETPWLDWLLLSKRPERARLYLPRVNPYPNVWIGATVEDQPRVARIEHLRQTPAVVRFLSLEPLLELVDLGDLTGIHWVIVGGESGDHARPFVIDWARSIVRQCRRQGVAVFVKQLGAEPRVCNTAPGGENLLRLRLGDKKGGQMEEWPADLRIREFPTVKVAA